MIVVPVLPDGKRCFIVERGANAGLRYEDIDLDMIRKAKHLYMSGYSFQHEEAAAAIHRALDAAGPGTVVAFNPAAPNLAGTHREAFTDFIRRYASVLILNEAEAEQLTGLAAGKESLERLRSLAGTVALTRGDRGSIVAGRDGTFKIDFA